ncbi:hypothetical protein JHK84_034533 [Glycine max]|nr:hypothetical protein JHK84_034533 [Glycine max]
MMGCCGCFGFVQKPRPRRAKRSISNLLSQGLLLDGETEGEETYSGDVTSNCTSGDDNEVQAVRNRSEDILNFRAENGMVCRPFPVKETCKLDRSEDENGNKMINEYVREYKIGCGSYGKVSFHKSHLQKLRVAPSETAMTDVLREVLIMKMVEHPNIVNLIEVIDDPESDDFYMVLEYVESKWVCEGTGHPCALGEETARKYLRDIVSGLTYLHAHVLSQPNLFLVYDDSNIVHGDIKPDNLLITRHGTVKIGDFSVSQAFEDGNDELRRSPGTPVFTAPECCLDPELRMTLGDVAEHIWVIGDDGPIPGYLCWCKRKSMVTEDSDGSDILD